ncbi:RluA family pseudouridine synthase [Curvivirga aplysinae]|uniref:RluA family pseudouridine synthase n=1 Tax=Curvivirga aplysinae TaxID=2529852 RepID=UPI0012BC0AFF|nr:RluA family pseudouridine synthase [Curvivirga aplysinae]MTI09840.1 RluA family pseudouridine synthase [Curvivirga aplysinae]
MSETSEIFEFTLPDGDIPKKQRQRLDQYIASQVEDLSRSRVQSLIYGKMVTLNDCTLTDPARRVKPGDRIIVQVPPAEDLDVQPEDIPLDIVFEDEHLLIVNKPAGMVVHPAPGNTSGTLVNALMHHCGDSLSGIGGVKRPGIVHRIDKDTSGLLVIAKSDQAHQGLSEQFAAHNLTRQYQLIVWGLPAPTSGSIEGNIGRHPVDRKRMAIVSAPAGKHAITHYKTIKPLHAGSASLIECELETGRTHQIRVHMTSIGHPLMGDPVYGKVTKARNSVLSNEAKDFLQNFNRQALHAKTLGFQHPVTGEEIQFSSSLPRDLEELLYLLS